jgi:FAD/FMN-containing dehydrogenase
MPTADPLAADLAGVVGQQHLLVDPDLLAAYETDWTRRFSGRARLVVRPGSTAEVAEVVRRCARAGATVVPQGGNTGLVGGGVPRGGEVVLSLARIDGLDEVDGVSGQVTVGAGATLAAVQAHVRAAGWTVGIDLAARDTATVGGMVATNAGGLQVMRFGTMRARLAGLEAVLADGSVVSRLGGLDKDTTGYDLVGLLCGSEGTLGIVTRVRLRLAPLVPAGVTVLLGLESTEAAVGTLAELRRRGAPLVSAEWFQASAVALVRGHTGLPAPPCGTHPDHLLLDAADRHDPVEAMAAALDGLDGGDTAAVADDRAGREALWAYRERITESIGAAGIPHKLDVALRPDRFAAAVAALPAVVADAAPAARLVLFGHLGDGTVHVNVLGLAPDDTAVDEAVLRCVVAHDGTIGAEHGIGVAKAPWLHLYRSDEELRAMAAIKAALDPAGMLNPGVLLPAVRRPPPAPPR